MYFPEALIFSRGQAGCGLPSIFWRFENRDQGVKESEWSALPSILKKCTNIMGKYCHNQINSEGCKKIGHDIWLSFWPDVICGKIGLKAGKSILHDGKIKSYCIIGAGKDLVSALWWGSARLDDGGRGELMERGGRTTCFLGGLYLLYGQRTIFRRLMEWPIPVGFGESMGWMVWIEVCFGMLLSPSMRRAWMEMMWWRIILLREASCSPDRGAGRNAGKVGPSSDWIQSFFV